MFWKHTAVAILLGSALATQPLLAQEPSARRTGFGFEASLPLADSVPAFAEESPPDQAVYEERDLVRRLNGLAKALNDFIADYNTGRVNLKNVQALRKALQDMGKSAWFKPQKEK
jgi:hypothetical protein